jgi:hypothetical protein
MRVFAATALIICAGWVGSMLPSYWNPNARIGAAVKLVEIGITSLVAALPAMMITGAASVTERSILLQTIFPWRKKLQQTLSAAEV